MKITTLVENTSVSPEYGSQHGLSLYQAREISEIHTHNQGFRALVSFVTKRYAKPVKMRSDDI